MSMADKKLLARDANRGIGAELLLSVRQMKAGKGKVVAHVNLPAATTAHRKSGLSQAEFANLLGVSVRTLQVWEQGHREPSGDSLLHGQEEDAYGDAGYQGADKRPDAKADVTWHIAMRPGKRKALDRNDPWDALTDKIEKAKAGIRAKAEHPFRVIKRQFGYVKTRYRGLKKNTAQLLTLFTLSNLWMVRGQLMEARG